MNRTKRLTILAALFGAAVFIAGPPAYADEATTTDGDASAKKTLADRMADHKAEQREEKKAETILVRFDFSGAIDEKGAQSGFGPAPTSIRDLVNRLHDAAEDDTVDGIVLRVQGLAAGWAVREELHDALLEVREKKPVHAFLTGAGINDFYVASAASTITIPPTQWFLFTGMGIDLTYYARMLEKVGVEMQVVRMGKYKSAMESFSETEISDASREAYGAILDTLYEEISAGIASGRGMSPTAVEAILGGGPYETEDSLALGLVDYIAGEPAFEDFLRRSFGEDLEFETNYGKEDGPDLAGGNPFTIFQELLAEDTDTDVEESSVALLYMTGGVVDGPPQDAAYEDAAISAYPLTRVLDELRTEENVKAVVIRVDSGGGSAMASDRIWEAVERLRAEKPVVVSMGNVAASGGYYVGMGADFIYAQPMTITGSIGVIGGVPYVGELYEKIGLDFSSITRGRKMNIFDTAERLTQEEHDTLLGLLEQTYEEFVSKAAVGRDMTFEQVHAVAQGRVWSGRDAARLGLIDATGGLFDAIDKAEELAGFDPAEEANLEIYPRKLSFAEVLERAFGMSVTANAPAARHAVLMNVFGPAIELLPEGVLEDASLLVSTLKGEGIAVMAPVHVTIR